MRRRWPWLLGLVVILAAGFVLVHRCAAGGAMGARYRTCQCGGIERVQYDRTAADGPRRAPCLGLVSSTTCRRSRGGEIMACQ